MSFVVMGSGREHNGLMRRGGRLQHPKPRGTATAPVMTNLDLLHLARPRDGGWSPHQYAIATVFRRPQLKPARVVHPWLLGERPFRRGHSSPAPTWTSAVDRQIRQLRLRRFVQCSANAHKSHAFRRSAAALQKPLGGTITNFWSTFPTHGIQHGNSPRHQTRVPVAVSAE